MYKYRMLIAGAVLTLALLGARWGRRIEAASVGRSDFLPRLQIPYRGWRATDVPIPPDELRILQPDSWVVRQYTAPDGRSAQLGVIAGHRKKTIHTPAFCMSGSGWETISQEAVTVRVPGAEIPATRSMMQYGASRIVMTYFFTDGEYSTRNLIAFQAMELLKRFRSAAPTGALVRVIVPIIGEDTHGAEQLSDDFARAMLPPVLNAVRSARIELR